MCEELERELESVCLGLHGGGWWRIGTVCVCKWRLNRDRLLLMVSNEGTRCLARGSESCWPLLWSHSCWQQLHFTHAPAGLCVHYPHTTYTTTTANNNLILVILLLPAASVVTSTFTITATVLTIIREITLLPLLLFALLPRYFSFFPSDFSVILTEHILTLTTWIKPLFGWLIFECTGLDSSCSTAGSLLTSPFVAGLSGSLSISHNFFFIYIILLYQIKASCFKNIINKLY